MGPPTYQAKTPCYAGPTDDTDGPTGDSGHRSRTHDCYLFRVAARANVHFGKSESPEKLCEICFSPFERFFLDATVAGGQHDFLAGLFASVVLEVRVEFSKNGKFVLPDLCVFFVEVTIQDLPGGNDEGNLLVAHLDVVRRNLRQIDAGLHIGMGDDDNAVAGEQAVKGGFGFEFDDFFHDIFDGYELGESLDLEDKVGGVGNLGRGLRSEHGQHHVKQEGEPGENTSHNGDNGKTRLPHAPTVRLRRRMQKQESRRY